MTEFFDINKLALQDTITVELRDPNPHVNKVLMGEDGPLYITVYGNGSKVNRDATYQLAGKEAIREKQKKTATVAEKVAEYTEFLATVSKETNLAFGSTRIESKADFIKLYGEPKYAWIVPQVQEALKDSESFLVS